MILGNNNNIEAWFLKQKKFPKDIDYKDRYNFIKSHLREYIQSNITLGALQKEPDRLLTEHGTRHFDDLIVAISKLVSSKTCELSALEIFFLLAAAQAHDIGNILGRENHESAVHEVFNDAFKKTSYIDSSEKHTFLTIAQAHSGKDEGDKDTINKLISHKVSHHDQQIRARELAAILRFADELCDSPSRALKYFLYKKKMPPKSEIFHIYAKSLDATVIDVKNKQINLTYKFDVSTASKKFNKGVNSKIKRVYLLDEIFERNIKMHLERIYCMRFIRSLVDINHIDVEIQIFTDDYKALLKRYDYRLIDRGYPSDKIRIEDICENGKEKLAVNKGKILSGKILKDVIKQEIKKNEKRENRKR